jgi:exodeoxyribonuclease VII large subunit
VQSRLALERTRLLAARARLIAHAPRARVAALRERLLRIVAQLNERSMRQIERRLARVERARQVLHAIGPGATLERGYAIVTSTSGQVLRDASLLSMGDAVTTRLARGAFTSTVAHIAPQPSADDAGSGDG